MEQLPSTFGRYELLELLATGGMAHIFRARLKTAQGTAKELVIKRVLPHLVQNRDFIDMFIDEARISMPLNHGNIVQVFEFGQEQDSYFLAMEYIHGRNLETILTRLAERGEQLPVATALYIASEVAKGLDYAHRFRDPHDRPTGIIHRDVSPQNILVGFQGSVKLTDFGIAKARSRIRQTGQGIIRGKACYLSPEQAECRELDGRSDQFSLGVVVFEMLTGTRIFEGDNEVATLQQVREARARPPSAQRPGLTAEVDAAVLKTLAREPRERFESVGAFQVVLSRILHQLAPAYTSAELAGWMRGLFSEDLAREITRRTTRERMLDRLAQEQAAPGNAGMSTGEILKMGTLAIGGKNNARRGRRHLLPVLIVVLLVGAGIGVWANWPALRDLFDPGSAAAADAGFADTDGTPGPGSADTGPGNDNGIDAAVAATDAGRTATDAGQAIDRSRRVRWGYLNLNANPWAYVEIDGRRLKKETPLFKIRVRAGKHRLRFFNPELKREKIKTVRVRPNQTRTISVQLSPP